MSATRRRGAVGWPTGRGSTGRRDCSVDEPVPDPPPAAAAAHGGAAPPGAGTPPGSVATGVAAVRVSRRRGAPGGHGPPRRVPDVRRRTGGGRRARPQPGARRDPLVRAPGGEGPDRVGGVRRAGDRAAGGPPREAGGARVAGDRRRVSVPVYRPRALRRAPGRPGWNR